MQKIHQRSVGKLKVVIVPMATESVTVLAAVSAGSRDEAADEHGAAHFLEHFVFKGTKKYPQTNDVSRAIDGIGGLQNAFTSHDMTGFWTKVSSDKLRTGLEVVAQLVCEPLLPTGELDKERGTIIEELNMYEDNHPMKAWEVAEKLVFPGSALGRPIIGTLESLKAMKTENLKSFRDRWYGGNNMVLVVAGGVGSATDGAIVGKKVIELVEQEFSSVLVKEISAKRQGYDQVFTDSGPVVEVVNKKTEQAHVVLAFRGLAANSKLVPVLEVLNMAMGGNMSSRLWNEIRERRGLAYYVKAGSDAHKDNGVSVVRMGVRLQSAAEAVSVVISELAKVVKTGLTTEELMRAKEAVKGHLVLSMEDSQEVAVEAASDWVMTGQIETIQEKITKIEAVTREQVDQVAKEIFDPKKVCLSAVGPLDKVDFRL